jgi:hypothetical protein
MGWAFEIDIEKSFNVDSEATNLTCSHFQGNSACTAARSIENLIAYSSMKIETWLRPNRRVLFVSLVGSLVLIGLACWLFQFPEPIYYWTGACLLPCAVLLAIRIFFRAARRRLAYKTGALLVDLGRRQPISVPIDQVECFFLGSSKTTLSGVWGLQSRAVSVVVRLAEKAVDFHDRPVSPRLGSWNDGYITIRGSWCEPVSPALIAKLNKRLTEAQKSMHPERGKAKGETD